MFEDCKIWFQHEVFYIESLISITNTINSELNKLELLLIELETGVYKNDNLIIDSVQNICTQAALISKFFWPIKKEGVYVRRGQKLREVYKINENSPLKSKKVRNFIEHFDEKLDLFLTKFPTGLIIPRYVGPRINMEAKHIFRAYFTEEGVFKIMETEYRLDPIINEIYRLNDMLHQDIENGRFGIY